MRTAPAATAILISGALIGGCSGGAQPPAGQGAGKQVAATQSVSAPPSPTSAELTAIPDGAWARDITTAEMTRRGLHLSPEEITANYLDDGTVRVVLRTQGPRWSLLVEDDIGAYEVGDLGTTSYDSTGRWVQGSDSTGGSLTVAWKVNGDTLVTSGITPPPGQPPVGDAEHVFLEGSWNRQS